MKRATILMVLVLLLTACGGGGAETIHPSERDGESGTAAGAPAPPMDQGADAAAVVEEAMEPAPSGFANDADGATTEGAAQAQAQLNRRIIYTGSLQLRVEEPRGTAQSLSALATRYGGYVSNANVYEYSEGVYRGTVQMRVLADQFDEALLELRGLALEVINEQLGTQDVTEQYVDLEARIGNLQRTETEIQALLTEARQNQGETEDILAVYRELTQIRGEIEGYQGQLNVLRDATTLATINVELVPPEVQVQIVNEGWSLTRVVRESLRSLTSTLQGLAELAIGFTIAVLPVLLLLALPFFLVARVVWPRLRRRLDRPAPAPTPPSTPAA